MLSIARALARDIKVLLLDEPYEGLAPVIVDEIEKTLRHIKEQGMMTVLVEQNAVRALQLADRAIILDTGSIVYDGTAAEVLEANRCAPNISPSDRIAVRFCDLSRDCIPPPLAMTIECTEEDCHERYL